MTYHLEYDTNLKKFTLVKLDDEGNRTAETKEEEELVFSDGDTLAFTEDGRLLLTTESDEE